MEVGLKKWPYADVAYLSVDHLHFMPREKSHMHKREYLTVEAVFVSENAVMFFDHYAKEYKRQRSELDEYFEKLGASGWKLTMAGSPFHGKGYQFKRYHFRRAIE